MQLPAPAKLTLANKVTLLRIVGVPVFILLMLYYTRSLKAGAPVEMYRWAAFTCFLIIAGTDALDGFLARVRNEVSHLGKLLDPLADKALLLAGLILFTRPSLPELVPQMPLWYSVLIISRDVVLIAFALIIHHVAGNVQVRPSIVGKGATVLQMGTLAWALAHGDLVVFKILIYAAAIFSLVAFVQYSVSGIRQLAAASAEHERALEVDHGKG